MSDTTNQDRALGESLRSVSEQEQAAKRRRARVTHVLTDDPEYGQFEAGRQSVIVKIEQAIYGSTGRDDLLKALALICVPHERRPNAR